MTDVSASARSLLPAGYVVPSAAIRDMEAFAKETILRNDPGAVREITGFMVGRAGSILEKYRYLTRSEVCSLAIFTLDSNQSPYRRTVESLATGNAADLPDDLAAWAFCIMQAFKKLSTLGHPSWQQIVPTTLFRVIDPTAAAADGAIDYDKVGSRVSWCFPSIAVPNAPMQPPAGAIVARIERVDTAFLDTGRFAIPLKDFAVNSDRDREWLVGPNAALLLTDAAMPPSPMVMLAAQRRALDAEASLQQEMQAATAAHRNETAALQRRIAELEESVARAASFTATPEALAAKEQERDTLLEQVNILEDRIRKAAETIQRYAQARDLVVAVDGLTYERQALFSYINDCAVAGVPPKSKDTDVVLTRDVYANGALGRLVVQLRTVAGDLAGQPQVLKQAAQ